MFAVPVRVLICTAILLVLSSLTAVAADLRVEFANPPQSAKPRVFWWWLQTKTSKAAITRDLEEMKSKGIGGAILWDMGTRDDSPNYGIKMAALPPGPEVMTPEWRDLVSYAIREADRLGIEISLNLGVAPQCGGRWVPPELSAQSLVWSEMTLRGPQSFTGVLPKSSHRWKSTTGTLSALPPIGGSCIGNCACASDRCSPMSSELQQVYPGGEKMAAYYKDVAVFAGRGDGSWVDISKHLDATGTLRWEVPSGDWTVLRFGHVPITKTVAVNTGTPGVARDHGLYIDHFNPAAVDLHFKNFAEPLIRDAGSLVGKALKYFHCDSYELEPSTWTPNLPAEFRRLRGYDLRPYLPILAGKSVGTPELTERFLHDIRRTFADCLVEHHYARLLDLCHRNGVGFHSESGGPHMFPVDALAALARNDIPMGEFWAEAKYHRLTEESRFFVKQAASAAHLYGKKIIGMEAFTDFGPEWEEDPWQLKPVADRAFLEGANRFFMSVFSQSPLLTGKPGYSIKFGSKFEPGITWWEQAPAFTGYVSRCQFLLAQGLFVADVLYYNGDQIPNFVQMKKVDPSLGFGYDYDVANPEVVLTRLSVKDGRLVLPDGMTYRLLVLPQREAISLEVLQKVATLVAEGATVVGPRPVRSTGLREYLANDRAVQALAAKVWGPCDGVKVREHRYGKGRVVCGGSLRGVLDSEGIPPDFAYTGASRGAQVDFLHRRTEDADIYFIANQTAQWERIAADFRVSGKRPELWDPNSGTMQAQQVYQPAGQVTRMPLTLPPYGSVFVVFAEKSDPDPVVSVSPDADLRPGASAGDLELLAWYPGRYEVRWASGRSAVSEVAAVPAPVPLSGPWTVRFPKAWGAPESVVFPRLISWDTSPDAGIRYFSGTAVYQGSFHLGAELLGGHCRLVLDLGRIRNVAEVRLNGKDLGIVWKDPWQVDIDGAVKPGDNALEISVTNLWPNRLIGDSHLPADKRFTLTNITKFTKDSPLLESGLLGPVRILVAAVKPVERPR